MFYSNVSFDALKDVERVQFLYGNRSPIIGEEYWCRKLVVGKSDKCFKAKKIIIESAKPIARNLWVIKNKKESFLLQTRRNSSIKIALISKMPEEGKRIWYHKVWGNTKICLCEIPQVERWKIVNDYLIKLKSSKGEVYICILI